MEKETNQQLTPEELKKLRAENTAFMQEQIKHLTIHDKYAELKASIASHVLTEQMAKIKLAQLMTPNVKESSVQDDTLKTE